MKLFLTQQIDSIKVDASNWPLYVIIGLSILLCISLLFIIILISRNKKMESEKKNEKRNNLPSRQAIDPEGRKELEIKELKNKIKDLEESNKHLTKIIEDKKEIDKEIVEAKEIIEDEIAPTIILLDVESSTDLPKEKEIFYVNKVSKEGRFYLSSLTQSCSENSLYKITLIDDNNATFEFINQTKSIKYSLDIPHDILFPVCEQIEAFNQEAKAIITQTVGKLIKENDYWKVIEKAKIKYD